MPRTKPCVACEGEGEVNDYSIGGKGRQQCNECGGNGYVPDHDPADPLPEHHGTNDWEDIDLTDDKPVPGRMANQTWRILEEQRQAAEENIREAEVEIERWSKKMVDATITKRMCEAGQSTLDGRS